MNRTELLAAVLAVLALVLAVRHLRLARRYRGALFLMAQVYAVATRPGLSEGRRPLSVIANLIKRGTVR